MNRYIKNLVIILSIITITGCGSNSKMDPLNSDSNITDFTSSTIEDERNATLNAEITLPSADAKIPVTDDYTFINATPTLEVEESNASYILKVQLIQKGFGLSGKTVNLKAFSNSNDKYGTFESMSSSTDDQGYAIFIYNAPEDIKAVNGKTITIEGLLDTEGEIDENNNTIELIQKFTLRFNETEVLITVEDTPLPFIVIPLDERDIELTSNLQEQMINIKVYDSVTNALYSEGLVKVALPNKIIDGVDVGGFEAYSVEIINGIATFNYTGPNDLKSLIESEDTSSQFQFFHEDNPTKKESLRVSYNPTSDYVPSNYTLEVTSSDSQFTMGLPDKEKTFSVILKNDKDENVAKDQVKSIRIISQNIFVGKIMLDGTEVVGVENQKQNPVIFNVKTNTKSGLIPIEIIAEFTDANDINKTLKQIVNIVVYSGPPTAMSISYVGNEHDDKRAKYIEKFAVTATDTYGNRVNTSPSIAVGAIVGYAVDGSSSIDGKESSSTKRLYFAKNDTKNLGTITRIDNSNKATNKANFTVPPIDNIDRFKWVDQANDKLVLFGEGYIYEALGKWDFIKKENYQLELKDDYFGVTRDNLFYAVGHNYRADLCSDDGREYVGFAESNSSKLDEEGTAIVTFKYDYYLTGKNIMLWVNLTGYQSDTGRTTRIGEAKKHLLRGFSSNPTSTQFVSIPEAGFTVEANTTKRVLFEIKHREVQEWYKNAKFTWRVTSDSSCQYTVTNSSNYEYQITDYRVTVDGDKIATESEIIRTRDTRECINGGVSFVAFDLIASADSECTFNINGILPSNEF